MSLFSPDFLTLPGGRVLERGVIEQLMVGTWQPAKVNSPTTDFEVCKLEPGSVTVYAFCDLTALE